MVWIVLTEKQAVPGLYLYQRLVDNYVWEFLPSQIREGIVEE
ncbi:hypothetical protein [Scytonema sp. NUACC26]